MLILKKIKQNKVNKQNEAATAAIQKAHKALDINKSICCGKGNQFPVKRILAKTNLNLLHVKRFELEKNSVLFFHYVLSSCALGTF